MTDKEFDAIPSEVLEELFASGEWFMTPCAFFFITEGPCVNLLAALCNYYRKAKRKKDGWFRVSVQMAQEDINCNEKKLHRGLAKLQKQGFIETKRVGVGAKRWIRLNYRKIYRSVKESAYKKPDFRHDTNDHSKISKTGVRISKSRFQNRQKRESDQTKTRVPSTKNVSKNSPDTPQSGVSGKDFAFGENSPGNSKPDEWSKRCEKKLRKALEDHQLKMVNWSPIRGAKEFTILRNSIGQENTNILLNWWIDNIETIKRPIVSSPKQFRKCAQWLTNLMNGNLQGENAMRRLSAASGVSPTEERLPKIKMSKSPCRAEDIPD